VAKRTKPHNRDLQSGADRTAVPDCGRVRPDPRLEALVKCLARLAAERDYSRQRETNES